MRTTVLAALALAGCTATYREPTLPADHPANPAAEIAALPEHSRTLAITGPASAAPRSQPEAQHEGHATPAPQQPAGHEHGAAPPSEPAAPAALYSCPMHPEVTSDKPDQRCPKCGMKLRKAEGGKHP